METIEWPRLSVIVPNYNHAAHLPVALKAILGQSVAPLEVIVVDDGSTDNSWEVLTEFARQHPTLQIHRNEKNQGIVYTLNRAIRLARGDYVFPTAADDQILPGLLEQSLKVLAKHPQAALSCTICEWRYVDSGLTWHMGAGMSDRPCYLSPDELVRLGKSGKLLIGTTSTVMRKDTLLEIGLFDAELRWHCDWYAAMVPAFRYGICFVPEVLSSFNIYSKSFYSSGHKGPEHRAVLLKLLELLNSAACADVKPRICDSGVLSLFATPMFRILLSHPEYRSFVTFSYLRRLLWRNAELTGKKILPRALQRWVLNRLYRARTR